MNLVFAQFCIDHIQFTYICENEIANYVKPWKHTKLNTKVKMPLAISKEMESDDAIVSVDGDRISYR